MQSSCIQNLTLHGPFCFHNPKRQKKHLKRLLEGVVPPLLPLLLLLRHHLIADLLVTKEDQALGEASLQGDTCGLDVPFRVVQS